MNVNSFQSSTEETAHFPYSGITVIQSVCAVCLCKHRRDKKDQTAPSLRFLFNIFNVFYLNIAHNSISITSHIAAYKNDKNVEKRRRTTDGLPKKQIQTVETVNQRVPNLPKQHLKKGNTNT